MKLAGINPPFLYWQAFGFHLLPPFTQSRPAYSFGFSRAAVDGAANHFCHHCLTQEHFHSNKTNGLKMPRLAQNWWGRGRGGQDSLFTLLLKAQSCTGELSQEILTPLQQDRSEKARDDDDEK